MEIYLAGSEHENTNLGKVAIVDRVTVLAEVRCVSQNPSVESAIDERDELASKTIKAMYDHKHDFNMPGAVVAGTSFNDRTDEGRTVESILLIRWLTEG